MSQRAEVSATITMYIYIYMYLYILKKVYDRNVVDKHRLYLLLGVIIFCLIDYACIYIYIYIVVTTKEFSENKVLNIVNVELL